MPDLAEILDQARTAGVPEAGLREIASRYNPATGLLRPSVADLTARKVAQYQASEGTGAFSNTFGTADAAMSGFVDMATAKQLPNLLGLFGATGRERADQLRAQFAAQQQLHPVGTAIGNLSGLFSPASPFGNVVNRAGTAAASPFANTAARLAETNMLSGAAQRIVGGLTQLAASFASSAGGLTAYRMLEGETTDGGLGARLERAKQDFVSPSNLILAAGVGGLSAAFRSKPDRTFMAAVDRLQNQVPALKLSPAEYRPNSEVQGMTASLRQLPGGRSIAAKFVNEGFYAPLANSIDDMQRSVSGGLSAEQSARQATQAVREFVGTKADAGTVEATRKASQAATFSQYGDAPVSRDDLANVVRAIREQRNLDRPLHTNEPNSAKFNSVVDQFIGSLQRARKGDVPYTVQDVWNISEQFGEIANFRGIASANNLNLITGRDVRDADVVYSALRAAIKNASPEADRGIHALELLRRVNESLSPLVKPVREGDPNLVLRFATAPNFNQRWDSFQQLAPVESQAAFSGAYLGQFIQKVATNREVLDPSSKNVLAKTMTREFQSPQSPFYAARFDRVLSPELRQHFLDVAGVSDRISRGIGAAAGSATAPRTADALLVAAGSKLPEMIVDTMADVSMFKYGLHLAARGTWTYALIRSALTGQFRDRLIRLSTGQPVGGVPRASAALQGPLGNLMPKQAVDELGGAIIQTGSDLADQGGSP